MLNYQIATLNVVFDNTYENVIRFNSREEQEAYFDMPTIFSTAPKVNFNVSSFYRTVITYTAPAGEDLSNQMNYNYCIVKDNNPNARTKYFYYFILETKFNNNRQVELHVELDVMNTYLLDLSFGDCMIERAHLNRFKLAPESYDPNVVTFDWGKDSKLYQREPIQPTAKVLVDREKINFNYDSNPNSDMRTWLRDNNQKWVYLFLAIKKDGYGQSIYINDVPKTITPVVNQFYYSRTTSDVVDFSPFKQPYIVLCYPLNNSTQLRFNYKDSAVNGYISGSTTNDFIEVNGGYANVVAAKISTLAPFEVDNYNLADVHIGAGSNLVLEPVATTGQFHNLKIYQIDKYDQYPDTRGVMVVNSQSFVNALIGEVTPIVNEFTKDEVKAAHELRFNPKLYNFDYQSLKLTNGNTEFDYEISKTIPDGAIEIQRTEVISPDITKQYVRIIPTANSVYSRETINNFMGVVSSLDYSMPYSQNNLDIYLANNKNFFLQSLMKSEGYIGVGIGAAALAANPLHLALAAGTAAAGAIGNTINTYLQVDNMKSSPEQLANANNNGVFNLAVTGADVYVERYSVINNELKMADDYMHHYGFTYNQVDKISNVINIRHNFNYVRAQLEIINSAKAISNEVRRKVKEIFSHGVTFWNVLPEMFNHDVANYERWLE